MFIKLFSNVLPIPFIWYQVCEDPLSLIFFSKIRLSPKALVHFYPGLRNFEIGPTAKWSTLDPLLIKLFFNVLAIPFIWHQVCEDPLSLIFFCENLSKYPGEKWTRDSVRPM